MKPKQLQQELEAAKPGAKNVMSPFTPAGLAGVVIP